MFAFKCNMIQEGCILWFIQWHLIPDNCSVHKKLSFSILSEEHLEFPNTSQPARPYHHANHVTEFFHAKNALSKSRVLSLCTASLELICLNILFLKIIYTIYLQCMYIVKTFIIIVVIPFFSFFFVLTSIRLTWERICLFWYLNLKMLGMVFMQWYINTV